MITRLSERWVSPMRCLSWAGWAWLAWSAAAGVPQPLCIYYGQAVDGYGLPYTTNATVILKRGTQEIARHTVRGSLSPGVNFALYVHLDEGNGAKSYSPRAVRTGDLVSVFVKDTEGEKMIMERPAPPVSRPGSQILINVTAAEDEDGDGLPDPWERELIAWSGGRYAHLGEVHGDDDADGDGQSNLAEYQAGTFPFLEFDSFLAEETRLTANGNLQITFWGVAGKVYRPECIADAAQSIWGVCAWATSDAGNPQVGPIEGTGDWLSMYLPVESDIRLFRLIVR